MSMRPAVVVVDNLVKSYRKPRSLKERLLHWKREDRREYILNGMTFHAERGEILGVLGANGAGKTTLLHSLAALAYWDSGNITIDGVSGRDHPMNIRRLVGLSTVEGNTYGRLSVLDNMRFFATLYDVPPHLVDKRAREVLAFVNLAEKADKLCNTLSTGMRQRLTVARALLPDPKVLLFDEPTRAVDPVNAQILRRLIRQTLVGTLGKTVILATNQLDEAWEVCDRVLVLKQGKVAAVASPEELQRKVASTRRYRVLVDEATDDLVARVRALPEIVALELGVEGNRTRLTVDFVPEHETINGFLQAISANGVHIHDIMYEGSSPAEVFHALTAVGS